MTVLDRQDERWMARCLELAARGAGRVSPNPMVGSVIVDEEGEILGEGWHEAFGGPHAERRAVADAIKRGNADRLGRAKLFVNLEPCNHYGKTPPCTDIILEAGIPRVVVGTVDANPRVSGAGVQHLRDRGVEVRSGVLEEQSRRLNEAFLHHVTTGRPLVTLKIAQTVDGQVATRTGDSRWITGVEARTLVHRWRSELDAVLVGRGTALADDPALTIRHVEGRQPFRVVLDREGRLPASLRLFHDEHVGKTIAVIGEEAEEPAYGNALRVSGGRILRVPLTENRLDLGRVLDRLGAGSEEVPPIQSVLVEAGPALATALLRQDLVDRLFVFIAPILLGAGTPSVAELDIDRMADALSFAESVWEPVGRDMLLRGYLRQP